MKSPRHSSPLGFVASLGLLPFLAATPAPNAGLTGTRGQQVLAHINAVIPWYRQTQTGAQWIGRPSDRIYFDSEHAIADQVVKLAFTAAEADAAALPPDPASTKAQSAAAQSLLKSEGDAAARVQGLQQKVADLDQQLQAAPATGRSLLQTQRDELAAELDLARTTHDSLEKIASFNEDAGGGLAEQIAELQHSIPEAFDPADAKPPEIHSIGGGGGGLIGRGEAFFALFHAVRGVEDLNRETGWPLPPAKPQSGLEAIVENLRQPILTSIRAIAQQGQAASGQAGSADEAKLASIRGNLQDLNTQLQGLAKAAVPLRQEQILLAQTHENLALWEASLVQQQDQIIRSLFLKVLGLALALAVLLGFSELWRRATFKYIHDLRRRRQFLLIRRFTTGIVIVLVVIFAFVSDYSSIATYAGFLTAGIAVALQTVIVSVAAYFLLIGRYGVKVGDRLSVSGVTGQVIDIGLVRFYMMELAGTGVDLHPTGRVAVFANSVLFQPTPIYRQMPGTDYTWHEAVVPLTNTADFPYITEKLLAVAHAVYAEYKPTLEKQHLAIERLVDIKLDVPAPASQLRFNDKGVELVLRYPVELQNSVDTDNAMASQLLVAIRADEKISGATTGMPRIQAAIKV